MPIIGYLKDSIPNRISTISTGDKAHRKKISPMKDSANMYVSLYVSDCVSHSTPTPTIPVVLKRFQRDGRSGGEWIDAGIGQCCPLCWMIIKPPSGMEATVSAIKDYEPVTLKQKRSLGTGRHRVRGSSKNFLTTEERIINLTAVEEPTVYELMESLGLARTTVRGILSKMIKSGKIVEQSAGPGRNHRTTYAKAS